MLQYGLYARKSNDDKRVTEKSIGEQVAECRALAEREGLRIVWQGEESKSAMKPRQRRHYTRLIQLIRKGSINAILCWHVNRLGRNMEEGGELVQLMIDGVLKEIKTPHATYRSGETIWPVVIEAATATQSSIDQRRTVKRAMEGNFRSGGLNYKAGPGYQNVRDRLNSKRGQVEPDPNQFDLIRKGWELMLTETPTMRTVVRAINSWGYRVRATSKLPERALSYQMAYKMFRNPFYAGFVRQNGELVRGRHTPMVTVEEFQRVQRLLDRRSSPARRKLIHAYTGIMRCGYCGLQITAEVKQLPTGPWETYHCSDSYNRCTKKGLALAGVRSRLSQLFQGIRVEPEVVDIAASELRRALEERSHTFQARFLERKRAAEAIQMQVSRLQEMWLTGLITDPARYMELQENLLKKQGEHTLDARSGSDGLNTSLKNLDRAVEYLKTGHIRFATAALERQRPIVIALGMFTFFGREKRIDLEIRPILRELISFAKKVGKSLEVRQRSYQSQNRAALEQQFVFGRTEAPELAIQVPDALLLALEQDLLPEFEDCAEEDLC